MWNLENLKFAKPGDLMNWAVLLVANGSPDEFSGINDPSLNYSLGKFVLMCRELGMTVSDNPTRVLANLQVGHLDAIHSAVQAIQARAKPRLILVVLSTGSHFIYPGLKWLCDVHLDVATVCVQVSKFRQGKNRLRYLANIASKINTKIGGLNHRIMGFGANRLKDTPTMLVGIAVTLSVPTYTEWTPSIAAVVASVDADFGQFLASLRVQRSMTGVQCILSNSTTTHTDMNHNRS